MGQVSGVMQGLYDPTGRWSMVQGQVVLGSSCRKQRQAQNLQLAVENVQPPSLNFY
jgi:hypothetical protein